MNEITPFDFRGTSVRVASRDGEPLWIASDACSALGLSNVSEALRALDADEKDEIRVPDVTGREQDVLAVTESGLYHLIFKSRKAVAVAFRRWVTGEVLPTIRRTGGYGVTGMATIIEAAKLAAVEIVESHIRLLRSEITGRDMFTLARWAKEQKVVLTPKQSRAIGGALAAKSRAHALPMGYEPSAHPHGRPPRTFTRTILGLYFPALVARHVPSPQLVLLTSAA